MILAESAKENFLESILKSLIKPRLKGGKLNSYHRRETWRFGERPVKISVTHCRQQGEGIGRRARIGGFDGVPEVRTLSRVAIEGWDGAGERGVCGAEAAGSRKTYNAAK